MMPTAANHWSKEPGRWEPGFSPEAYALVPTITTPRPSPDGRQIAYSRGFDGRLDLWVIDADGGWPLQLTDAAPPQGPDPNQRHASAIAWTPGGERVVYASTREGKLWSVAANGGAARPNDEAAGNHHSPAVSPDGMRVAYVSERGESVTIVVADIAGSWTRTISVGDEYVMQPRWSPDGNSLLYGQWPHYDMPWDERALVIANVETGERRIVAGGGCVVNGDGVWSPDGTQIAFVSDQDHEYANLWVMDADGGNARPLVREDNRHLSPAWSPDGRRIAYVRNDDGDCQLWCWEGGETRQITREPGHCSEPAWLDDHQLVYVHSSPLSPADLYVVDARNGVRRQLTRSATGGLLDVGMVMPEHVAWESRDGLPIHGLLFSPVDARPGEHPLVVSIHGGPVGQTLVDWRAGGHIQYLVSRGYVVIAPNYRGSLGYGRSFMEKLYGDWGGGDLDDNITGAEFAIDRGLVNPRKVVAMGGSAGGYSTLICLTKAPDFFRAGVCRFGIADLSTFTDTTWVFERHYIAKLMGAPGTANSALYRDRSPITHVDAVKEPLLILQGDSDIVCHPSQMASMVDALKRAGKDVESHTYAGEGHGWRKVSSLVDDAKRIDDFLVRKVLNR
ncbi:MAG: S9 family peptidase [Thermomicrobiales bacterium]